MRTAMAALLLFAAPIAQQTGAPGTPATVEDRPLESPSFALVHTNDTRGYLESCG